LSRAPGYIWHQHNFMANSFFRKIFLKFLGAIADKVIVITKAMENNLRTIGLNAGKIKMIYNGISIEKFNASNKSDAAALQKQFGIPANAIVITCVGDARPEKGQIFLIKAFQRIIKDFPDSEAFLLLAGSKEGSCYELLKIEAEKRALTERIVFLSSSVIISTYIFTSGLGPTNDISPFKTLIN